MENKINKLNEQEAKQLLTQLAELLKEREIKTYYELVMAIDMAVYGR